MSLAKRFSIVLSSLLYYGVLCADLANAQNDLIDIVPPLPQSVFEVPKSDSTDNSDKAGDSSLSTGVGDVAETEGNSKTSKALIQNNQTVSSGGRYHRTSNSRAMNYPSKAVAEESGISPLPEKESSAYSAKTPETVAEQSGRRKRDSGTHDGKTVRGYILKKQPSKQNNREGSSKFQHSVEAKKVAPGQFGEPIANIVAEEVKFITR